METRGPRPVRHDDRVRTLSPARARVLEHLKSQSGEVTAEQLAGAFGQHANTVRGHLDGLARDGLVLRRRAVGVGPGRPAWRYRANPDAAEPDLRVREHGALAAALAAHLARTSPDPVAEARLAGQAWGAELAAGIRPAAGSARPDPAAHETARADVLGLVDRLGFAPVPHLGGTDGAGRADADGQAVVLTRCPLLDVARQHPGVVCQVHLGLVVGALERLGGDPRGVDLLPFSEPHGCRLVLPGGRS